MKFVILIITLLIVSACSANPHDLKQTDITVPRSKEIYIVSHGWHTGFVVPAKTILSQLPQLYTRFGNTPFIEFGWGDNDFYQAKEITSGLTMRAIFWPSESVIHAVAIPKRPDIYFTNSEIEVICVDDKHYSLLISFLEHSFHKDSNGNIIKLKKGIYGNSQFYKGEGDYYLMNTCNKWTAKGLKSAGLNILPAFKLSASSIMDYLSEYNESQTSRTCSSSSTRSVGH